MILRNVGTRGMRRTTILLKDTHYEYLKNRSEALGKSMCAIVREWIETRISQERTAVDRDPIHSIIGIGRSKKGRRSGPRHDELLYGKRRS